MILICEECKKEFVRDRKRRFCCLSCAYKFRKGQPQSAEFIARRAAAMKGIKKSPEHVAKMSAITQAKWDNGEYSRSRPFTEEHKKNISLARQKLYPPKPKWIASEIKCFICGTLFLQKGPNHKYCSKKCLEKAGYNKGKLKGPMRSCINCGSQYIAERKDRKYCSYECDKQYRSKLAKVEFTCEHCGKSILVMKSFFKGKRFCSYECANLSLRNSRINRFAAVDNSERMKGKNNPVFTHPESFRYKGCQYYDDLGLRLRSGWEANIARIIRFLGFQFEYEPQTFKLSDGTTYTPDFYVPELDELIEVKGRWMHGSKKKVELFIKDYPDRHLNIIGPPEYQELMNEFKEVINA